MKRRKYYECAMESPLYRQVAREMAAKRAGAKSIVEEYRTKRGKNSKII